MTKAKNHQIKKVEHPEELKDAFDLRVKVFMDEQKVDRKDEFDGFDDASHHFIAKNENGDTVGVARWRKTPRGIKLERFAVAREYRNLGIASRLVEAVLEDIKKQPGYADMRIYLHAQADIIGLYKKYGFQEIGDKFDECGILHQEMELK